MNASFTPKKDKQHQETHPTIKVSPVKVPTGAKQIGNYILGKTIGSGTYGKVHLGLHIPTGQRVAVKIIDKTRLQAKDLQRIHREIQILKKIMHPSLIQLYEIIQTERSLLLVTEYMQNGELFNYIIERKKLPEDEACKIFHQLVEGIQYLHHIGIAHRDIKPENILIDYDNKVKIIDFGLSNVYKKNQKLKTQCGSPCYAAPEMIQGKNRYDPIMVDIWSAGIVLFAMLSGYLPFCDPDTGALYKKILAGNFKCPTWISEQAKDIIQKILVVNPSKRAKIQEIKQHPWYTKIDSLKMTGIDTRYYKIPYELSIVHNIQKMGVKIPGLPQFLQTNSKNKQTAFYYILAKKMVKEGYKLSTFFASQYFRPDLLTAVHHELIQNGQSNESSTQIQVETVSPVPLNSVEIKTPETNSAVEFYSLKSSQFKQILDDFMNTDPKQANKEKQTKKGEFYANNLQNKKKKQSLKIEYRQQTRQQKTLHLMKAYKRVRCQTTSLKVNLALPEISRPKKLMQTLDTASTYANPRKKSKFVSIYKNKHEAKSFF